MATKHPSKPEDQAQAILALATDLRCQLSRDDDSNILISQDTQRLLERALNRLPFLQVSLSTSTRRQLDTEGTKLWNLPLLRVRTGHGDNDSVLLCQVKALAYVLLEAAAPSTGPGNYRSLELAFKVIKPCIENGLLDLSQKVMESAAARLDVLENSKEDAGRAKLEDLTTEYYMLRISLAWSQKRLDIADHLFSKIPEARSLEQQRAVVDICYAIGDAALRADQYETSSTWLGRALTLCELWSGDESQNNGQEFKSKRLLVLHVYARANLHLMSAESEGHLRRALHLMRTEYGNSFPVLVFSLEVLNKDALDDEYFHTLKSSINAMDDSEASLKIVYHHITKLGSLNLEMFVETCGQLLNKLAGFDIRTKEQWMEKVFVSVIWTLTNTSSSENHCPSLAEAAAQVLTECGLGKPSEDATQASLILIWKYIDTMLSRGSVSIAEQWCRFLLKQPMFQSSPHIDIKSFRKLILCVLENYNSATVRRVFDEIPEDCKGCPLTLYLMYRLALLTEDTSLATSYIQSLCKQNAEASYIWSCIADALQMGKTDTAVQSLEGLTNVSDDSAFGRLQIANLLQYMICTIREDIARIDDSLRTATVLLETALSVASSENRKPFTAIELRWFSCKSYSIALELYKTASPQETIKLLELSTNFTKLAQRDMKAPQKAGLLEYYLKCTFLQSMISTTEARREKKSVEMVIHYKQARETIKQFQTHAQSLCLDSILSTDTPQWLDKYRIILSFDFEATVCLHQWDDLASIIETAKPIVSAKLSSVFLDCLLRSGAPSSYLSQFVKQMIRTFHSSSSPFLSTESGSFNEYLPRHLRCLFSLSTQAEEYILAESVLDQALILARNNTSPNSKTNPSHGSKTTTASKYGKAVSYPEDELQWLATSAFNRAVEFFLVSADAECRRWAGKAIALADLIDHDRGELGRLLRKNLAKLQDGSG